MLSRASVDPCEFFNRHNLHVYFFEKNRENSVDLVN